MDDLSSITATVFGFLLLNGICNNVLSDYLWARAVVLTSPTVATIGMSITIPLAMVSDGLLQGTIPTYLTATGAVLVILGFVSVNVSKKHEVLLLAYLRGGYQKVRSASSTSNNSSNSRNNSIVVIESAETPDNMVL